MGHGEVIGKKIGRREIEVDQPGHLVAQHQYVVGKQVAMAHAMRQSAGPTASQKRQFIKGNVGERGIDSGQRIAPAIVNDHVPRCQPQHLHPRLLKTARGDVYPRSEEHTSELQSLMRISYAVFCWKTKTTYNTLRQHTKI